MGQKKILHELRTLRKEVRQLKKNLDADAVLTPYERKLLKESYEHEKQGKLVSSEEVRRRLGIPNRVR
jgi:hypothetical protein